MIKMKMPKKWCIYFLLLFLFVVGVTQLVFFHTNNVSRKSVPVIVDPSTKKHWFRLKINAQNKHLKQDKKIILLWTTLFGQSNYIPPISDMYCREKNCFVTSDRSYLPQSDGIVFHLRDIAIADMPSIRYPWQRWILLHHESQPYTPDILQSLNGKFNWTITHRLDSDIVLTPLPKRQKAQTINVYPSKLKTRMVVTFISNCHTSSNRESYIKELQKAIPVDVFGKCGQKECLPKMSNECYNQVADEYRFYLSFENSICKDYVTEKFFNILHTDMVPVVMGGANYSRVGPPSSYINALSFHSPRELASFLLSVAKDEKKYNSYFDWKKEYIIYLEPYACQLCEKLHKDTIPSVIDDIHDWWFRDSNCHAWDNKSK